MKQVKKASLLLLTLVALFANVTSASANSAFIGSTRTVRVNALFFANSTTATARGQVNSGARVFVDGMQNSRFLVVVTGGTAAQHNGWLNSTGWVGTSVL
ncbi:MAG: hypothetical protein FWF59_00520 [Turicibacter sp.]|nr:hypothetical protein [Turicibacter sp.]